MDTQHWQTFSLPDFALQFQYPDTTPQGHAVEMDDMRAHFRSFDSDEAYFELSRHARTTATMVYEREKGFVTESLHGGQVSPLRATTLDGKDALEYTIQWDGGERTVILLENQEYAYRFIYDPHSELNQCIRATLKLV